MQNLKMKYLLCRKAEEGLISITGNHSPLRKLRFHYGIVVFIFDIRTIKFFIKVYYFGQNKFGLGVI